MFALATQTARRYAEAHMTSHVRINRMGALTQHASGEAEANIEDWLYDGKARVYETTGPLTMAYGEAPSYHSTLYASIPVDEDRVRINDMLEITAHDDAALVDRVFRITHVDAGGLMPVVRRLTLIGADKVERTPDSTIPPECVVAP